jgi:hypothetical protein
MLPRVAEPERRLVKRRRIVCFNLRASAFMARKRRPHLLLVPYKKPEEGLGVKYAAKIELVIARE